MAGGFAGQPLGSFSGRGADFQPFQFILEQRRLAAQAEAQRKQQAAAQQQSFVMALMAKKQEEAQLAQQQAQFQASQQARAAEKQMAVEQFRAEQNRLREAEQAQLELRKLGEQRAAKQDEQRALDRKAEMDADVAKRGLQAKGAEAMTWVETQAAPVLATNIERLGDPLKALDATEAWLLDAAQNDQDMQRRAATTAQIRAWRKNKQDEIEGGERIKSAREYRDLRNKASAEEADRKARADKNRTKIAAAKAELAGIQDDLKMWAEDLLDSPGNADIQTKIDDARKRRNELYQELAALE